MCQGPLNRFDSIFLIFPDNMLCSKYSLFSFRKAIFRRIQHSESGIQTQVILGRFLKGQTQLKWHLGQVGPTEFGSLLLKHFFLKITFQTFQHYVYTASRTELS